jgi:hypothetical protein
MRVIVFNATINNISVSYIVTVSHIGGGNQSTWRNYDMYVTDKTMFGDKRRKQTKQKTQHRILKR